MRIEQQIVAGWAKRLSKKVVKGARTALKQMGPEAMLSGADSGLRNVWEEICVQARSEESFFWAAYINTMNSILAGFVDALEPDEQAALWAVSDEGWDYIYDHHANDIRIAEIPICVDDICRMLQAELLSNATEFSNSRVDRYLIRGEK